jgi:hypothetical protein
MMWKIFWALQIRFAKYRRKIGNELGIIVVKQRIEGLTKSGE